MPKIEKLLMLDSGWVNLVLDIPKADIKALVVFCHGLTGDRCGPQKILTLWANTLAENDYLVARFDFRGAGDSSGKFEKTTFAQMQEDLEAVVDWCLSHYACPYFILAGLSLGGVVAVNTLTKYKSVSPRSFDNRISECKAICLFNSDVRDSLTFNLCSDPLPIRDGQFFLHTHFFKERLSFLPEQILANSNVHRLLIYGDRDTKFEHLVKKLELIGVYPIEIKNTGHLFESWQARSLAIHKMIEALNHCMALEPVQNL